MKAESESQRPKGRVGTVSALNAAIEAANLAEKVSSIAPAKVVFGFVRDSTVNELDHAKLGLFCADISRALDRGTNGKKPDELGQSVYGVMGEFSAIVADIQMKLAK